MEASRPTHDPIEVPRRKPGATGRPVLLADGEEWLLAEPTFRAGRASLTHPDCDAAIDRFHERVVLGDSLSLAEILATARLLLLENYELSDDEASELLEVAPGPEAERLARAVLEALFGREEAPRGYADWIRASLLANGLGNTEIPASALNDVLSILLSTNRTVPPSQFVDACRAASDRESLERLV
jgi:hypothetical protein